MYESFEEQSDEELNLASPDGWLRLAIETDVYQRDAASIAVCGVSDELAVVMAACFTALKLIVLPGREELRYEDVGLLVPPGSNGDRCRAEIMRLIPEVVERSGGRELAESILPLVCRVRSLVSLAAPDLVRVIEELPDDSAWILIFPELYRDPELDLLPTGATESFSEISARQLNALIAKLAPVALRKRLLLVFAVDRTRVLVDAIQEPESIGIISFSTSEQAAVILTHAEVAKFHEKFREGGWSAVQSDPEFDPSSELFLARALVEDFQNGADGFLVWQVLEPFISRAANFTSSTRLGFANAALSSGHEDTAVILLAGAVAAGIVALEELFGAAKLAYDLSQPRLLQQIATSMQRAFPDSLQTKYTVLWMLFERREFGGALKLFEQLGDPVGVAQCQAYLGEPMDPEPYLAEMEKEGRLEEGLINCAEEALHRGDYLQSLELATRVPAEHQIFPHAIRMRAKALRRGLTAKREGEDATTEPIEPASAWLPPQPVEKLQTSEEFAHVVAHLVEIMRVAARNPITPELRVPVERLLENQLEEPLVIGHLSSILLGLATEQEEMDEKVIEKNIARLRALDRSKGLQPEDQPREFQEEFFALLQASPGNQIRLGEGILGEKFKAAVGPNLIDFLANFTLGTIEQEKDLEASTWLMHLVCLCCKADGDSVTDLVLIHSVIDRFVTFGAAQDARNLAETALRELPPLQPEHLEWRISQSWSAMAEACLRSGNPTAALRYLCFSYLASDDISPSVELQRRRLRIAARIFRDLRAYPLSVGFIGLERHLLEKAGALDAERVSLEVLEMQLRLKLGASKSDLVAMFKRSQELAAHETASERFPLLTVQASIIFQLGPEKCPADLVESFKAEMADLSANLTRLISLTTHAVPTVDEVSGLLVTLPDAQDHHYLSYQMANALPAFVRALRHAVSAGDQELFLMTAGLFAQPALSVKASSGSGEVLDSDGISILKTTTVEGMEAGKLVYIPRYSFAPLADISLLGLQAAACEGEEILVLACEPGAPPDVLVVSRDQAVGPLPVGSWSVGAFARWRATFIDKLRWRKPANYLFGLDALEPPVQEVRNEFVGLELGRTSLPQYLTIVPPGHLFGFAWQLSAHDGGFLCEATKVAIAPSASWLVAARTKKWAGSPSRKAWLGSRNTPDSTLLALKQKVDDELERRNFSIVEGAAPSGFEGCEIVFIAAHGGTGKADYFRSASDLISHYSPTEMAYMLRNCGCVILAVCSGGRSDSQTGSNETLGLVSSLLREGVRCIVAPPWPLDIEVVQYWLPAFLAAMDEGECVGYAAEIARTEVRKQLDHPCAWGQLHVYGDQCFRLARKATETGETSIARRSTH